MNPRPAKEETPAALQGCDERGSHSPGSGEFAAQVEPAEALSLGASDAQPRQTRSGQVNLGNRRGLTMESRMLLAYGLLGVAVLVGLELAHLYGLPFTPLGGEYQRHRDLAFRQVGLAADAMEHRLTVWITRRHDHARVVAESAFVRQAVGELVTELHRTGSVLPPEERARTVLPKLPVQRALTHDLILASITGEPYQSAEVADAATGIILASSHAEDLGLCVQGQSCLTNSLARNATVFTGIERDPESGRQTLVVSRPVVVGEMVKAVLLLRINPSDTLFGRLNKWAQMQPTGETVLVDQNKVLLAPLEHPLPDGSRARSLEDRLSTELTEAAVVGEKRILVARDYRGVPVLAACRPVQISPTVRWGLVVKQDQAEVFAAVHQSERVALFVGLIGLVLLLGLSAVVARRVTRPVLQLCGAARQVAAGDLAVRASVRSRNEIGLLAATFNAMVERVQQWQQSLQTEVQKRTTDLQQANISLQAEITGRQAAEAALRRERDNFVRLLESMADGVYVVNSTFDIQFLNPVLEKAFGPVNGRKCYRYFHERDDVCPWCQNAAVLAGRTVRWEWHCSRTNRVYDLIDTPLLNGDGSVSKLEIFRDVTERKMSEAALRDAQQRFQTVADFTYDWEYWLSPDRQFLYTSPSCERITGYTREEFRREPDLFPRILHPDDRPLLASHLEKDMAQEGPCEMEFRIQHRNGQERWIGHVCQAIRDDQGRFLGRRASNRDITERKQAQEALRQAHDELERRVQERTADLLAANAALQDEVGRRRSLEVRIVEISEHEQRRIGQDLHDGLCQHLTGLAHLCNECCCDLVRLAPQQAGKLRRTASLVQEAIDQAHTLARGLFPVNLQADGLMAALKQLVAETKSIHHLSIRFVCDEPMLIEDNATATHLYRIAQEALSNALKHSQGSQVTVQLSADAQTRRLTVCDNGRGFKGNSSHATGLGMETMRFRARSIGAQLEIKPRQGGGTEVICSLPNGHHATKKKT